MRYENYNDGDWNIKYFSAPKTACFKPLSNAGTDTLGGDYVKFYNKY